MWSLLLLTLNRWSSQPPSYSKCISHPIHHHYHHGSIHSPYLHVCHEPRRFMIAESNIDYELNHDDDTDESEINSEDDDVEVPTFDYTSFQKRIQKDISEDLLFLDDLLSKFPPGKPNGFVIIQQYPVPFQGFHNFSSTCLDITEDEIQRLQLEPMNVTLPVALMMLDPAEYPSFSRARKACRKGSIIIHRGPLTWNEETQNDSTWDMERCIRGRVGDRIVPGDVIGKQIRIGGGFYPSLECAKPPFDLPVVYEDDHFAIVNKPAGVCVYAHRSGGQGRMTIRSALPYVLKPPRRGTMSILRRPATVHRLDKPTSGLLIVAKTKPAMVELTRQFVERRVKKTYTAIVNGIPDKIVTPKVSSKEAQEMGFDVSAVEDSIIWNLIDHPVDEKSATTLWRSINYARSLVANDDTITMVELKPKTGRFHQLRRHMAWICETPIVGDSEYDENTPNLRERGLFLCANKVSLDHPYFNTQEGRDEWNNKDFDEKFSGGMIQITEDDIVQVRVAIELPRKFSTFFAKEDERGKMIKSVI